MPDKEFMDRLEASIEKNLPVLNRLESHLGCTKCHAPLLGDWCPVCQNAPEPERVCGCGVPMSLNPHPEAGDPGMRGLEVGTTYVCIPCTVKSRHDWAERARRGERNRDLLRSVLQAGWSWGQYQWALEHSDEAVWPE